MSASRMSRKTGVWGIKKYVKAYIIDNLLRFGRLVIMSLIKGSSGVDMSESASEGIISLNKSN